MVLHFDLSVAAPLLYIVPLAFCSVVYIAKILPAVKRFTPDYFEEYTRDFQLPTLSQRTLEEMHLVVIIYIPSAIILFFCYLGPLIFHLRVPILTSTSTLLSVIRHRTGRFVGAAERCASLLPLLFPVAVLIQTLKFPEDLL